MKRPPRELVVESKAMRLKLDAAFSLYLLGMSPPEIATRIKTPVKTVQSWQVKYNWLSEREMAWQQRQRKLGKELLTTQTTIKAEELEWSKKLLGMATLAAQHFNPRKCRPKELIEIIRLASQLGRLGAGMPLTATETTVRHDLGDSIKAALEKVYGADAIPVAGADETVKVIDKSAGDAGEQASPPAGSVPEKPAIEWRNGPPVEDGSQVPFTTNNLPIDGR